MKDYVIYDPETREVLERISLEEEELEEYLEQWYSGREVEVAEIIKWRKEPDN